MRRVHSWVVPRSLFDFLQTEKYPNFCHLIHMSFLSFLCPFSCCSCGRKTSHSLTIRRIWLSLSWHKSVINQRETAALKSYSIWRLNASARSPTHHILCSTCSSWTMVHHSLDDCQPVTKLFSHPLKNNYSFFPTLTWIFQHSRACVFKQTQTFKQNMDFCYWTCLQTYRWRGENASFPLPWKTAKKIK